MSVTPARPAAASHGRFRGGLSGVVGRHGPLRAALLGIVVFGILGLGAELVLLEHYEEVWQYAPFVALGLALLASLALAVRPGRATVRLFRVSMVLLLVAGCVGMALHFWSNRAFELEMDASAAGLALVWAALRGATPSLAPGALLQLGLLGLVLTIRHPSVSSEEETR